MKIALKILGVVVIFVILLLIIAGAGIVFFGERAVKSGVEAAASDALGVAVDIKEVDLSIVGGKVTIKGLRVQNPPRYEHKNLLEMDEASVTTNIRSLATDTVRIEKVGLDGMNLVIEQKGLSNNLNEVIDSLKSKEKARGKPSGKKLQIDQLEITNTVVLVKLIPVPGTADTIRLPLAPIRMTNLGSDKEIDTGVLAGKIMTAIAAGVAEQGVDVLPREMLKTINSTLGKTIDLGKKAAEKGKDVLDSGKEIGTEIIEGVKGILKPKKKEQ